MILKRNFFRVFLEPDQLPEYLPVFRAQISGMLKPSVVNCYGSISTANNSLVTRIYEVSSWRLLHAKISIAVSDQLQRMFQVVAVVLKQFAIN